MKTLRNLAAIVARVSAASLTIGAATLAAHGSAVAADMPSTAAPAGAPAAPPPFFFFSDTVLEYRFESSATDPGAAIKFPKQIANITHVDAYQFGTNFISVDILQSTNADPIAPVLQGSGPSSPYTFTGEGSRELYGLYRGTISGNAVTNSKMFSFGKIVKDVSFEYGGDLEDQNTAFAPQKTDVVFGPNIAFNVPGLLNVGIHVYKEWNHNGLTETGGPLAFLQVPGNPNFNPLTGKVDFDPTAEFEVVYLQPLTFTGLPLTFNGFANIVLPKGVDGFDHQTRTEFLTTNRLTLDIGSYLGRPKILDAFVGYKFWFDKFGNNATYSPTSLSYTPGSHESQFICGVDYHLQ